MTDHDALDAAYLKAVTDLNAIFYEHDPDRIGIALFAPPDEYEAVSRRLLSSLRNAKDDGEVPAWIRQLYPNATSSLARDAYRAI